MRASSRECLLKTQRWSLWSALCAPKTRFVGSELLACVANTTSQCDRFSATRPRPCLVGTGSQLQGPVAWPAVGCCVVCALVKESWPPASSPEAAAVPGGQSHVPLGRGLLPATPAERRAPGPSPPRSRSLQPVPGLGAQPCPSAPRTALSLFLAAVSVAVIETPCEALSFPVGGAEGAGVN